MTQYDSGLQDPISYYDQLKEQEWERLDDTFHGKLEFEQTITSLKTHLPANAQILDAGGGAGRYTRWLLNQGYDVTLLDISSGQLEVAQEKIQTSDWSTGAHLLRGTIDSIPVQSDQFDATLCLGGPLSHVLDEERRERAASELARVTAPSSPVFVSVMGRLAMIQTLLQLARKLQLSSELVETGSYDADLLDTYDQTSSFVECHFFRVSELKRLLTTGKLSVQKIVGLEGIASLATGMGQLDDLNDEERTAVRDVVDHLRDDPAVAEFSSHILAICTT